MLILVPQYPSPAPRLGALARIRGAFDAGSSQWLVPNTPFSLGRLWIYCTAIYLIIKSSKHPLFLLTFPHSAHKPELSSGEAPIGTLQVRILQCFFCHLPSSCRQPAACLGHSTTKYMREHIYLFSATPFLQDRQVGVCIVGVTPVIHENHPFQSKL